MFHPCLLFETFDFPLIHTPLCTSLPIANFSCSRSCVRTIGCERSIEEISKKPGTGTLAFSEILLFIGSNKSLTAKNEINSLSLCVASDITLVRMVKYCDLRCYTRHQKQQKNTVTEQFGCYRAYAADSLAYSLGFGRHYQN